MSNPWLTDVDGFIDAIEEDEYAELELPNGDTLVTDWEGDGTFLPYVELTGDHGGAHPTDILHSVQKAIGDTLDIYVDTIEYDAKNGIIRPYMDRPERPDDD